MSSIFWLKPSMFFTPTRENVSYRFSISAKAHRFGSPARVANRISYAKLRRLTLLFVGIGFGAFIDSLSIGSPLICYESMGG